MRFSPLETIWIKDAIARAMSKAFQNPNHFEPQLVANLVNELPLEINKLNFSVPKKLSATGVFVHSRPLVTCNSFPESLPASVEIGDLLLIRNLVKNKIIEEQRALLLQAKKLSSRKAKPDNENQWHLYEQWPEFTYAKRSGKLTGQVRHINEPDMYDAAKYLFLSQGSCLHGGAFKRCRDWRLCDYLGWPDSCYYQTAQPTKPEISRFRCFADELIEFLNGNAGKIFTKPLENSFGWNRFISDILEDTTNAKSIYMGRAAGQSKPAMRGNGVLMHFLEAQPSFSDLCEKIDGVSGNVNVPPNAPENHPSNDDGGVFSIITFVVNQMEE